MHFQYTVFGPLDEFHGCFQICYYECPHISGIYPESLFPVWNFGADFARKRGEIEAESMFSGRDRGVTAFSARNITLLSCSTGGSQLFLRA